MARRFRRSLSPINSIKHVVDTFGDLAGGVISSTPICTAVPNADPSLFVPGDVRVGATVNGFFISLFIIGATGSPQNGPLDWYIIKQHEGQGASLPAPGQTGVSKIRNQIFHEEKGLSGSGDGTAMAFKGVIAVPKSMRRMREGDRFLIQIRSEDSTQDAQFCLKAIYKSYF